MSWCPYRELGLARGASIDEVKKAFKDLAKAHHPDKHLASAPHEQSTAAERFRVGYFFL
jgi:curved DNA-binding protein CbpA